MSDKELHDLHAKGPSEFRPGAWEILDAEVRTRGAVSAGAVAACPNCGATTVQGQLVPMKNVAAGMLTALLTDDMAASVLVAQNGRLTVQAFCLSCGAIWLPFQEYLARAVRGDLGGPARDRARRELEAMIDRGTGFKLVTAEAQQMAAWAKSLLAEGQ